MRIGDCGHILNFDFQSPYQSNETFSKYPFMDGHCLNFFLISLSRLAISRVNRRLKNKSKESRQIDSSYAKLRYKEHVKTKLVVEFFKSSRQLFSLWWLRHFDDDPSPFLLSKRLISSMQFYIWCIATWSVVVFIFNFQFLYSIHILSKSNEIQKINRHTVVGHPITSHLRIVIAFFCVLRIVTLFVFPFFLLFFAFFRSILKLGKNTNTTTPTTNIKSISSQKKTKTRFVRMFVYCVCVWFLGWNKKSPRHSRIFFSFHLPSLPSSYDSSPLTFVR